MAHIPKFPPKFKDWAPGNPFELEPPFPRFIWNPWLTSEQRTQLEAEAGRYATKIAEAFVPPTAGFEAARKYARYRAETLLAHAGIPFAAPKARKEKKTKAAPEIEELKKALTPPGALAPELEASLTDAALEEIIRMRERYKRELRTEEKVEMAKAVADWAEEEGVKLTEEQGMAIVNKALGRFAQVRP